VIESSWSYYFYISARVLWI